MSRQSLNIREPTAVGPFYTPIKPPRWVRFARRSPAGESERLKKEEDVVQRQQQKTKADITRLIEVLKSLGAKGLQSVEQELRQLETEQKELSVRLKQIQVSQAPSERISRDAKTFVEAWQNVGELLDAANTDEQVQLLRHYIEVLELHPVDEKGRRGTYVLKLFPEVHPDRTFDEPTEVANLGQTTKNGTIAESSDGPELLTEDGLVCMTVGKAPPVGLEPTTMRLTAARSTN